MKNVKLVLNMEIDDEFEQDLKKLADHRIASLLDLESFPEILRVYDCKVEFIN